MTNQFTPLNRYRYVVAHMNGSEPMLEVGFATLADAQDAAEVFRSLRGPSGARVVCLRCGADSRDSWNYCPICGASKKVAKK